MIIWLLSCIMAVVGSMKPFKGTKCQNSVCLAAESIWTFLAWLFLGKGWLLSGVSTGCLETGQRQEIVQHRTRFESGKCFHTSIFIWLKESGIVFKSVVRLKGLILKRNRATCEKSIEVSSTCVYLSTYLIFFFSILNRFSLIKFREIVKILRGK